MTAQSYEYVKDDVRRWCGSYRRMLGVLHWKHHMRENDWWRLLGDTWPSCDHIGKHKDRLRRYLRQATERQLQVMMTRPELETWSTLPDPVTVYRGCYEANRDGLSWTLSRAFATNFPRFARYKIEGEKPLLLTGSVQRARMVLKLDRGDMEVIATAVEVLEEKRLPVDGRPRKTLHPLAGFAELEDSDAADESYLAARMKSHQAAVARVLAGSIAKVALSTPDLCHVR